MNRLLEPTSGIVRHRGKISSAINNAQCVLDAQKEFGSFAALLWSFMPDGRPIDNKLLCVLLLLVVPPAGAAALMREACLHGGMHCRTECSPASALLYTAQCGSPFVVYSALCFAVPLLVVMPWLVVIAVVITVALSAVQSRHAEWEAQRWPWHL